MREQKPFSDATITLLVSGFGLGFYIPGLLLRNRLEADGQSVDAIVFETLFDAGALDKTTRSRDMYRQNFALAIKAQKVPFDVRNSIDPARLDALLTRWAREGRRRFVALSGHWVHVLDAYQQRIADRLDVTLLHMDGSPAPSWLQTARLLPGYADRYRPLSLYTAEPARVDYALPPLIAPTRWQDRDEALVIHGGGWGLGNFEDVALALAGAGFHVMQAGHGRDNGKPLNSRTIIADDPDWRVWHVDEEGRLGFPPFGIFGPDGWQPVPTDPRSHGMQQQIARSRAIVSKPGAGTLIDCLATQTPLIMLEPFGDHEAASARIWSALGLGIPLARWASSGFSRVLLDEVHNRISAVASDTADLAAHLAHRLPEAVP